ncbi:hypothetical protein BCON_0194g00120 [Botryotinia convoluta]|uniref:2EXR domain-containing protein n=1 Tax=Botryotinia convoluta TaxID=54673 RepID=A0A4Z1HRY7_9HELO|nr:hypothetical protein BCON_0194g00120 [Botryotinia convoluta]
MEKPRENDLLIWTKEAQTFQNILKDVKKATNKSHKKFFQTIHAKDIVTHTQDWVKTIQVKLSCERERRIAHRNDGIGLLYGYYVERKYILRSQRHSRDAHPKKMYALSQKMMEQHKRLVANERNINEVEYMEEMARIAMKNIACRAKHSFKSKEILPRVLLKSRRDTCTRDREQKINEGVLPNLIFQRVLSDRRKPRSQRTLLKAQRQRRKDQLTFLPGPHVINLFERIRPHHPNPVPLDQKIAQSSSPQDPNNKFSKFTSLPLELCQMIWKAALLEGRHVFEDDWENGRCHLLPSLEVSNSKNSLQLACRESHEVVQERYTFVFQPMSDGMTAQDPENITALNLLPFNPDKDIVHRYLLLETKDTWGHELWGLTPVKHLSLDGDYFYDSENNHATLTYHDEMDAIECIEAACPTLEILTIRVEGNGFIRDLLGYDTRIDFDFIELNSSIFDHVAATISNGKNYPLWKIRRNEDLRDIYGKHAKLFDRTRGRNSEYWKRVNMRVVLLQKPVYDWPYRCQYIRR